VTSKALQVVIINSVKTAIEGSPTRLLGCAYSDACRYHGIEGNSYPLPNDEDEVSRLDDLHFVYRVILGDNIVAPITRTPTDILDVGTGSGRWPIEVADRFPDCHVTGMDISPVNPIYEIPENCYFIVEDLTNGLLFNTGSMDLVHSRYFPLLLVWLIEELSWRG
jgi:SAM-dependent methyltransferase